MSSRVLVLSNPVSGTERRRRHLEAFTQNAHAQGFSVELVRTSSSEDMEASSRDSTGYDIVVAAGGDGTVHTVVNGLMSVGRAERPQLAILPMGRGNDLAAELGIGDERAAAEALTRGSVRTVDVGRTDRRFFLAIAGTGFDAQVARRAQHVPLLSGRVLYSYAVFATLLRFRPIPARVTYDGGSYEGLVTFVAAGNGRRYGGGMLMTPHADLADGLLDLCLVKDISRTTLVRMFPTVFSGTHVSHPRVLYTKTASVRIETEERAEVFADGEFVQETPVTVDIVPAALDVRTPPGI